MTRMLVLTTAFSLLGGVAGATPKLLGRTTNAHGDVVSEYAGGIRTRREPSGTLVVRSANYIIKNYAPTDARAPMGARGTAKTARVMQDVRKDEIRRQLIDGTVEYQ